MKRDSIFDHLHFTPDFSVDDWNQTLDVTLRRYFRTEEIFLSNKEILRTELVNYIRVSQDGQYLTLFHWTFKLFKDALEANQDETIKIIVRHFYEVSDTDLKWMTNVLTQPDTSQFSEHDKITYYFKIIDEVLEGVFKPRFKLLCKIAQAKKADKIDSSATEDFGQLVNSFPEKFGEDAQLYLRDPIFSIPTNQWRNIAAHKSFIVNQHDIVVRYGRKNITSISITYEQFFAVFKWTQDMYRALRLAEVLIDLNFIHEIVQALGGTEKIRIRFEASLFHLVNNMQIVGFKFVSTEELGDIFNLNFRPKANEDLKNSLIHASQCLDQLSCAIYDDKFVRDKFLLTQVTMVDSSGIKTASATVEITKARMMAEGKMTLNDYIQNVDFKFY